MADFGFPNDSFYLFRIENRLYRVHADGAEVLDILTEFYNASVTSANIGWALCLRDRVRRVELLNVRSVLTYVIQETPDERMRWLAIWLRGRCGGYMGTSIVAKCAHSPNFKLRKESVRALRRLSGWSQLREIANSATNSRIRIMATQHAAKPLDARLARVLASARRVPTSPQMPHLWMAPGLRIRLSAPKSLAMIRELLERIRSLVANSRDESKLED